MAWNKIPNSDDPNALVREYIHEPSGAKIVEVLYGAKDAEGNPVQASDEAEDGHGTIVAMDVLGAYQMLSWTHSSEEGGEVEYGKGGEDPLGELEASLENKEALIAKANEIAESGDYRQGIQKLNELQDQWKSISYWHTPKEDELWTRFKEAKDNYFNALHANQGENRERKRELIERAKALADSVEWKKTSEEMQALMDQWKQAGSIRKEEDDRLWEEFKAARQVFFDRRSEHHREIEVQHEAARKKKEALVEAARDLVANGENFKETGEKFAALMDEWKQAGNAGKEAGDRLWEEFNQVRQEFYEKRHAFYDQRDRERKNAQEQKEAIVAEARAIAEGGDYSAASTSRMKELDQEWKASGRAGREVDDRLWAEFTNAKDIFWNGKRSDNAFRHQEWEGRAQDAMSRKERQIADLRRQIEHLHSKIEVTADQASIDRMYDWIDEKEAKINELTSTIADIQSKLN